MPKYRGPDRKWAAADIIVLIKYMTLGFSSCDLLLPMFSSFASFLPSSLHLGPTDLQSPVHFHQDDPASEDEPDDLVEASKQSSDLPQPSAKPREKTANEVSISAQIIL
jgi:hypothetical protein